MGRWEGKYVTVRAGGGEVGRWGGREGSMLLLASFPGPRPASRRLQYGSGRGPGTFSHVSDITGRKAVERLQLNVGEHN